MNQSLPTFPSFNVDDLERFLTKQDERRRTSGVNDLIDSAFRSAFKINNSQYDYICENATNQELDLLVKILSGDAEYRDKKNGVAIVKRHKLNHANINPN